MATKIQVRRDTAANWTSAGTVLSSGEMGYETDTGYMKIGDGTTAWAALSYFTPGDVSDDNTTYTISVAQAGADANVTLTGSDASNDTVTMVAGNNLTVTVAGDNVTMDVDNDLANYSNATSQFLTDITAQAIGSLSDVDVSAVANGNVLAYNSTSGNWEAGAPAVLAISDLSDVDTSGVSSGAHLQYDGANWTAEATNFNAGKVFLSGLSTNKFIQYRNAVITIGAISSGDAVDFPTDSGTDAAMEWEVNNPGTDFVANITPGPVNINRSQYFRIIIDNTSGATKGSISGLQRFGATKTVNWTNGSLPVVSGEDVYDIYEFYCFRGDGGSDETWYGTLLTNGFSGTIASLLDVDVTANSGPVNGYLLAYNSSTSKWENTNQIENRINYRNGLTTSTGGLTQTMHMYDTPLTITEGDDVTFAFSAGVYGNSGKWVLESVDNNFTADITGVDSVTSVYDKWIIVVNNNVSPGVGMTALKIDGVAKTINWAGGKPPETKTGRFDIYEIERWKEATALGDEYIFVRHWNDNSGGTFDGDLTGSVFADDSTLLIDGIEGTFNLDGRIAGNLTVNNGNIKVAGPNGFIIEKTVSGNAETIGKITATNGSVEYGEIEFKTGPDGYVNNSEINWYARIGGVKTPIFEIKGTSLGKSGFELNPSAATDVDFSMQGSTDPLLIFADSGDDRVGFGKIPTQGKVDVDGDVYADNFIGGLRATGTAPASASSTGTAGDIRYDADYIYICVATDTWKRVAISTW